MSSATDDTIKHVEINGAKLVIMAETEYERLVDAVDLAEAKAIAANDDPVVSWDQARGTVFALRIAAIREAKGLSQKELAQRLDVAPPTLCKWEKNDANLTMATIQKIAGALGCAPHELFD